MLFLTRSRFEARFAPCRQRLYGYAVAMTRDRDQAEDLLHDCVARAIAARSWPADEAAFRAWLFAIMRNLWIDQLRAQHRRRATEETMAQIPTDLPLTFEGVMISGFAVRQAFDMLTHDHREVLALVDISGFSYHETASLLGVAPGTVMSRVSRARQNLAKLLADDAETVAPLCKTPRPS